MRVPVTYKYHRNEKRSKRGINCGTRIFLHKLAPPTIIINYLTIIGIRESNKIVGKLATFPLQVGHSPTLLTIL